jgi:hypothetical protein
VTLIETALIIDITVYLICLTLLLRHGRLSYSHAGTIYLIFHLLVVTWRLFSINIGSPTLYDGPYWGTRFDPVTHNEIARAALMADVALVMMTIAWLRTSASDDQKRAAGRQHDNTFLRLDPHIIYFVSIIAFPLGIAGMALRTYIPGLGTSGVNLGTWDESSWIGILPTWVGLVLLAMIYMRGFRWWLVIPLILYLLVMAFQGYHRYRVIVPVILVTQMFLEQRSLRWPPLWMVGLLLVCGVLFFPLKTIGRMVQQGATPAEILNSSAEIIVEETEGESGELQFLDQFASTVTLVDKAGKFYYGRTYLPLLTLPIPRELWAGKPTLNEYQWEIQTTKRPMATMGMISTILGEAYANFGYVGIVVIPYILAHLLALWYFRTSSQGYYSVGRFAYLLIAANLLQVYRDGLVSLVVFALANMMPLMIMIALHLLPPIGRAERLEKRLMRLENAKK